MKKLIAAILIFAFILTQSNFALALDKTPARNLRQPTTEAKGTADAVGNELGVPEEVVAEANAAGGRVSPLTRFALPLVTAVSALLPATGQTPAKASPTPTLPTVVAVEPARSVPVIKPINTFNVGNPKVFDLAVSPQGDNIVVVGMGGATVWDVRNPQDPKRRGALAGHDGDVLCAAFNLSGNGVVTGGRDGKVMIWDANGCFNIAVLERRGEKSPVSSIALTDDGRFIIAGHYDGSVDIWNTGTRELVTTLQGHTDRVYAVLISPDGKRIYTTGYNEDNEDKTLIAWDANWDKKEFKPVATYQHGNGITSAVLSPDGKRIAIAGTSVVKIVDANTLQPILASEGYAELTKRKKAVSEVVFLPHNSNLLFSGTIGSIKGDAATISDIRTGMPVAVLDLGGVGEYSEVIYAAGFKGNVLYVGGYKNVLIYQLHPALAEANAVGKGIVKGALVAGAVAAGLTVFPVRVGEGPERPAQPGMEVTISQKSTPSSTEPIVSNQDDWVPVYQPIELKVEGHSAQQDIYKPIMSPFASRPERPADLDGALLTGEFKPGVSEDRPATFWMFFTPPEGTNEHSMVKIEILDSPATSPINVSSFIVNDKSIVTKGLAGYTLFRLADLSKDEKLGVVSVPVSLRPYSNEDEKGRKFSVSIRATAITPIEGIPANIPPENVPLVGEQANAMAAGDNTADVLAGMREEVRDMAGQAKVPELNIPPAVVSPMTVREMKIRLGGIRTNGIVGDMNIPVSIVYNNGRRVDGISVFGIASNGFSPIKGNFIRFADLQFLGTKKDVDAYNPPLRSEAAAAGTILVVDDEETVMLAMEDVITYLGHNVITAESGEKALEILNRGEHIDLIVSDNDMTGMTGLKLAEKRLESEATKDIPFVLFTASPPNDEELNGLKIAGILQKPAPLAAIRNAVAAALQPGVEPAEAAAAGIVSRLRIYMAAFAYRRAENILTKTATMASAGAARLFFDHVLDDLVEVMISCGVGSENEAVAVFKRYLPHSKTLHLFREAFREKLIAKGIAGRIAPFSSADKQQGIYPDTKANAAGEPVEAAAAGEGLPPDEVSGVLGTISAIIDGTLGGVWEVLKLRNAQPNDIQKIYIDAIGRVRFAVRVKDPLAPHTGYEELHYLALNPTPYFLLKTLEINNVQIALTSAATSPRHTRDLMHIFRNLASIVEKKESIEFDDGLTVTFTGASTPEEPGVMTIMSKQEALAARVAEMEAAVVGQAEGATVAGVIASALHARAKEALLKAAIEAAEPADTTVCLVFTPENYLLRAFADLIRLSNLNNRPVVVLNEKQMAELKQPENIPSLLNGIAAENGASEVKICTSEDEIYNMLSGKPVNIGDSLRLLDVVKIDPYEIFNEIDKYLGQLGIAVGDVEAAKEAYRALAGSV